MWPGFIWNVLENGGCIWMILGVSSRCGPLSGREVCLDEALHLDDSGGSLLDVAGVHLERSRSKKVKKKTYCRNFFPP